ncbi:MAG TPA: NADH-quinone oxidoreductase subunit J [bacterium]|nr:NADH-quinone oxidoreductase subunit J [bacterium]
MTQTIFYILSAVILAGALLTVTLRNLYHCALALALTMFCIAGVYLYLGWEFLAAVQVLIYVGAVTVLIIFGIMLTRRVMDEHNPAMNRQVAGALLVVAAFALMLYMAIQYSSFQSAGLPMVTGASPYANDVVLLSDALLQRQNGFAFSFEFVSVLLLSALVGAVVVARKDPE